MKQPDYITTRDAKRLDVARDFFDDLNEYLKSRLESRRELFDGKSKYWQESDVGVFFQNETEAMEYLQRGVECVLTSITEIMLAM